MPMVAAGYSVWGALVLNLVENWLKKCLFTQNGTHKSLRHITFLYCLLLLLLFITVHYCLLPFTTFLYCLLLHITFYYFSLLFITSYYCLLPSAQPTLLGCPAHPFGGCPAHFRNLCAVQPTHLGCPAHSPPHQAAKLLFSAELLR